MESLEDDWELSREEAHPNARRLLEDEFYWDVADDNSPFGNDTGWDTLEFYRAWIQHSDDDEEFLAEVFDEWEVDRELAESLADDDLGTQLEDDHYDVVTYDDVVIALAFAQLVLEGASSPEMAAAATRSLERQMLPEMIDFRDWADPDERLDRCSKMIEALRAAV